MQAKRRSGINPLAYLGVDPITPPMLAIEDRDPTDNDFSEYELGAIWMVQTPTKVWMMVKKDPGATNKWIQIYPGDGSGTNFFPTDSGTAVQVGGILNLFGSNDIMTSASGNTVTIGLENDVTIVSSLTITPILNKVLTTDGSGLITGVSGTNKQILMWSTPAGDVPGFHSVTSDDGTVNFEWSALTPGAISITAIGGGGGGFGGLIADDTNTAVPSLNKVNVFGDAVNLDTTASGSTLTVTLRNILTLPQTNSAASQGIIKLGTERFITNLGTDNTFVGELSGNFGLTTVSATGNTGLGTGVLNDLTTSANNTGVGVGSLTAVAGGTGSNTALGALSGAAVVDGHNNLLLGYAAGLNYTSENHNISLSNEGTALDAGVIRIGNTTDHNHCYIQGIYGKSGGATNGVVSVDNDGKMFSSNGTNGQIMLGGGTGPVWATLTSSDSSIIFTPGVNQLDMVAVGGGGSSGIIKLGADVGTPALPLLGQVDIFGGTNINTSTGANSVVVNLDDWISLPATNAAGTAGGMSIDSAKFMHAIGTGNTFLGKNAGNLGLEVAYGYNNVGIGTNALRVVNRGNDNTAVGYNALYTLVGGASVGDDNVAVGSGALYTLNSASGSTNSKNNVAIGSGCMPLATTANSCVGIGKGGFADLTTGSNNISLGAVAGGTLTTGSGNVYIATDASSSSESYKIRIGSVANTLIETYVAGVYNKYVDNSIPVFVDANGQLGKPSITALGQDPLLGQIIVGSGGSTPPTWRLLRSTNGTIVIDNSVSGYTDLRYGSVSTCAFHAVQGVSASNVTGDGTLYNLGTSATLTEVYDYGSDFYGGSGSGTKALFTAPQTGLYLFICTVLVVNLPSAPTPPTTRVDPINIVTSNRTYSLINPVTSYTNDLARQTITFTAIADMDASDTAYFQYGLQTSVGTKTVGVGGTYTTVSGYLIG